MSIHPLFRDTLRPYAPAQAECLVDDLDAVEADLAAYERDAGAFRPCEVEPVDPRWDEEDERLHRSVACFLDHGAREAL